VFEVPAEGRGGASSGEARGGRASTREGFDRGFFSAFVGTFDA